jgi:hypothetical protein
MTTFSPKIGQNRQKGDHNIRRISNGRTYGHGHHLIVGVRLDVKRAFAEEMQGLVGTCSEEQVLNKFQVFLQSKKCFLLVHYT